MSGTSSAHTIEQLYQAWTVRHYGPPRLLLNKQHEITHLFNGAERYLGQRSNAVSQPILQEIVPALRSELRSGLNAALALGKHIRSRWTRIGINGEPCLVQMHIGLVDELAIPESTIEIVFWEQAVQITSLQTATWKVGASDEAEATNRSQVQRLQAELRRTQAQLQSANEALHATNEQLEHYTAELRTLREELASVKQEHKQGEEALHNAEQFLQGSIDALTSHVVILDQQGVILKVNASWRQFAHHNHFMADDAGIGMNYLAACAPEQLPPAKWDPYGVAAKAGISAVLSGELPIFAMEYPCHSPTEQRWFVMRAARFSVANRMYLVVAHKNITERKLAEQALRASEAELRLITNAIPGLIAYVDSDQRYRFVNATYERWFGQPSRDVIGKSVADLLDPASYASAQPNIERALAGYTVTFENYVHYVDYSRTVLTTYVPARDERGQVAGFYALTTDITELKAYEAELTQLNETLERRVEDRTIELERSNRELDQFAYVASHDLKAPLRGIAQLATWISEDVGDQLPARTHEHLRKLHGRIQRMSMLLDDLLSYSRVGRQQHAPERIPLVPFIHDIVETLSPPADFVVKVASALDVLYAERVPLEIALRNLIGNAIKHHNRTNGVIQVRIQPLSERIQFVVQDDGPGIDAKFHERIFELFQTLQPRDRVEGSGMGLAIVKKVIESRGGEIIVESTPGQGSTFSFTWPLMEK